MAAGWQLALEQLVGAMLPPKEVVPGTPWHTWQTVRSGLAARPWKAALVALSQVAPRCRVVRVAVAWQAVLLKQPGAVTGVLIFVPVPPMVAEAGPSIAGVLRVVKWFVASVVVL